MGFRAYKKSIEAGKKKAEQEQNELKTIKQLEKVSASFAERKKEYLDGAKTSYRNGEQGLYNNYLALVKNIMFQKAQIDDMITNYKMARDLREMGSVRAEFADSVTKAMKEVDKISSNIRFGNLESSFAKGIFSASNTSKKLQEVLRSNGAMFSDYASEISAVNDAELKQIIDTEIKKDSSDLDARISAFEAELMKGKKTETAAPSVEHFPVPTAIGGNGGEKMPPRKPAEPAPAPKAPPKASHDNKDEDKKPRTPEECVLEGANKREYIFEWNDIPTITFDDIAGLDSAKEEVMMSVIYPINNPELYKSYGQQAGGGMILYGPPGTGKTMLASAIAKEIGAKFCSIKASNILATGIGNPQKKLATLFAEARSFPCAVIFFDEFESLAPKNTNATHAKEIRSEFLAQIQGVESYGKKSDNILFLIGATNKPWDVDPAFLRPGRFGIRIYAGLPDTEARKYIIEKNLGKVDDDVTVSEEIDVDDLTARTEGYNGADITALVNKAKLNSLKRSMTTGEKHILPEDFEVAFDSVKSSVQRESIEKMVEWNKTIG